MKILKKFTFKEILLIVAWLLDCSLARKQNAQTPDLDFKSFIARAWQQPSPDIETPHWLELSKKSAKVPSKYNGYGTSKVYKAEFGYGGSMPVEVGGQTFQLLIDTGSSDTWVASRDFKCVDGSSKKTTQASCGFGALYNASAGFEQIPNRNFNLTYADSEFINGIPGLDTVTVAGITVPSTHINIVNKAFWYGDNFTSGLIGLAYPALTSVYSGTDPTKDRFGSQIPYAPIFTSMFTNASIPPVFSLALERQPNSYGLVGGGKIAFGGLPPVKYSPGFVSSQIIIHKVIARYPAGQNQYSEYTIIPNGFVFPGAGNFSMASANVTGASGQVAAKDIAYTDVPMIVDSGTTLLCIPKKIAEAVNAAFSPPAIYSSALGAYQTSCDAVPPRFGIVISGKTFYLNPEDIFAGKAGRGKCTSAIVPAIEQVHSNLPPLNILGDTFLKNVLAVFDVGAGEMRFASREEY